MKYKFKQTIRRNRTPDEIRARIMALEKYDYEVDFSNNRFKVSAIDGAFLEVEGSIHNIEDEKVEIQYRSLLTYHEIPGLVRLFVVIIFLALALFISYTQAQYLFSHDALPPNCYMTLEDVPNPPPTTSYAWGMPCWDEVYTVYPKAESWVFVIVSWVLVFFAPPRIINLFDPAVTQRGRAEEALSELEERFGTAINS